MEKIYLPKREVPFNNVEEVIRELYNTDYYKAQQTYYDADCTMRQCHSARRSFGDMWLLAQTYFPEATEKDVGLALHNMKVSPICTGRTPLFFFCNDVEKPVVEMQHGGHPLCDSGRDDYDVMDLDGEYSIQSINNIIKEAVKEQNETVQKSIS